MRADGSDVKRLTTEPGYDGGPFFSPDGTHITYRHFTPDGRTAEIFTMKTDGSERGETAQPYGRDVVGALLSSERRLPDLRQQ